MEQSRRNENSFVQRCSALLRFVSIGQYNSVFYHNGKNYHSSAWGGGISLLIFLLIMLFSIQTFIQIFNKNHFNFEQFLIGILPSQMLNNGLMVPTNCEHSMCAKFTNQDAFKFLQDFNIRFRNSSTDPIDCSQITLLVEYSQAHLLDSNFQFTSETFETKNCQVQIPRNFSCPDCRNIDALYISPWNTGNDIHSSFSLRVDGVKNDTEVEVIYENNAGAIGVSGVYLTHFYYYYIGNYNSWIRVQPMKYRRYDSIFNFISVTQTPHYCYIISGDHNNQTLKANKYLVTISLQIKKLRLYNSVQKCIFLLFRCALLKCSLLIDIFVKNIVNL